LNQEAMVNETQDRLDRHLIPIRRRGASAAVLFVHGFSGSADVTWGRFPEFLASEPALTNWDIFSLGYATSLRVDVPNIWASDPPLSRVARSFKTAVEVSPLADYRALAVIAHSMGGLVVQRALLDLPDDSSIGYVVLFGTPSKGLVKAVVGGLLKRQLADMSPWSWFILSLRYKWKVRFRRDPPFALRVVAGDRDEFVPPRSSLRPFPDAVCRVVPGNHLGIVKPEAPNERSVRLVVDMLSGIPETRSLVDSARLAVERREFVRAVSILEPHAAELDDGGLVTLALALESLGRSTDACELLEARQRGTASSTDAQGVLAGRLKRRWLVSRRRDDWARSRELYASALRRVESENDALAVDVEQGMYHAINVAFLDLMSTPFGSSIPPVVTDMAKRAHDYALRARRTHWQSAVIGDVKQILNDLDRACAAYETARHLVVQPREVDSMYSQAVRIADRIFGSTGVARIEASFQMPSA